MNSPKSGRLRGVLLSVVLAGLLSACSTPAAESEAPPPSAPASASASAKPTKSATPSAAATVEPRAMEAWQLQVGDCYSALDEADDVIGTVDVVPCDQLHENEVYAAMELPAGEYPGDAAVEADAEEFCLAEFEPFVGTSFQESVLDAGMVTPSSDSWTMDDDREILCTVMGESGSEEGSLKDANR